MKKRISNIELLRIIAMLMIITLHYFGSCAKQIDSGELPLANQKIYLLLESLCICGVDIFVLITGYFSTKSSEIKINKIVKLLFEVSFWDGLSYLLLCFVFKQAFSIKAFAKSLVPLLMGIRWFVKAYILLLILIPFINIIIQRINKKSYQILLFFFFLIFSVWPTFLPNPPIDDYGYGFFHFVLVYLIAAYIRIYVKRYPKKTYCLGMYFLSSLLVYGMKELGLGYAWAYNNIFVILAAISLFLLFIQINIDSEVIRKLSEHAFGVFMVHTGSFFSRIVFRQLFCIHSVILGNYMLFVVNLIGCVLFFYLFGSLLDYAENKIFKSNIYKLINMIKPIGIILHREDI